MMRRNLGFLAPLLCAPWLALSSWAQPPASGLDHAPAASTATTASPFSNMGAALSVDEGPWVLGEVLLFVGPSVATDPALRDKVRGQRNMLYTKADVASDLENLRALGRFEKIEPLVFSMAGAPVPAEFEPIAVSSNQVRLVFALTERPAPPPAPEAAAAKPLTPPAAVSGVILTPTAYRGAGKYTTPGMGLDFNACYFIGRLYGRNSFENSVRKVNYIDRLGEWLLSAEGKMQIQSETRWRPALAVGGHGSLLFRDAPQPSVNTPTVSVTVSQKTTKTLSDAYVVASKNIHGARVSAGYMQGSTGDIVGHLTEFLAPQALEFYAGRKGDRAWSRSMPFASVFFLPKPQYPLGVEFIKFNGASLNPWMLNFKLGYFLKLNFDVSYIKFNGGYEFLGLFQFRYNQFPKR
ncbi:MAG: hypothetical protein HY927_12760 [Elusimicrobia bacterium]|nr:hypothetical protein [Elusimicrobiota bacterium]